MTQPIPTKGPRILLFVVTALVLLLAALPFAAEVAVPFWLKRQGFEQPWLEDVDFNPFTGVLEIRGLYAARDGQPMISLRHLRVMADWMPLWERRIHLRQLRVDGLELDIRQRQDELFQVAGFSIPAGSQQTGPAARPWLLGIDSLDVTESFADLNTVPLTGILRLNDVHLNRLLQWQPDRTVTLDIEGRFNEGAVGLKGDLLPFAEVPTARVVVKIDALDLSKFAILARPALQELGGRLSADTRIDLTADSKGMTIAQQGGLRWQGLNIRTGEIEIRDPLISWNGKLNAELSAQGGPDVTLAGELASQVLRFKSGDALVFEGGIQLDTRKATLKLSDQGAVVEHEGELLLTSLTLNTPQAAVQDTRLSWSGAAAMAEDGALTIDGRLSSEGAQARLVEDAVAGIERLVTGLKADTHVKLISTPAGSLQLTQEGELSLLALDVAVGEFALQDDQFRWDGKTSVTRDPSGTLGLDITGGLAGIGIHAKGPGVQYANDRLDWSGTVAYSGGDAPQLSGNGSLAVEKVSVSESKAVLKQLNLEQLRIDGLELISLERAKAGRVTIAQLFLRQFQSAQDSTLSQALAQVPTIELHDVDLDSQHFLDIGRLALKDIQLLLRRTEAGRVYGLAYAEEPEDASAAQPATSGQPAMRIRLGEFTLDGDTRIRLQDESVSPRYEQELHIERLTLADLDSDKPGQTSPVQLLARLGRHSTIEGKGTVQPFAERLTLNLELDVEAVDLYPFSAYSAPTLGYALSSGQLAAKVKLASKAGMMDGNAHLLLHQLEVKPENDAKMAGLTKKLDMPLGAGLALLKDKEGNIDLDLPIKGDIDSPDVDIGDIINTALGKAMKTAALGALTYAIQPYGAILAIVQLADGAGSAVKLEAIDFKAGGIELNEKSRAYAAKLVGLLKDRPGAKLRLCAHAVEADRQALIDQVMKNSVVPPRPRLATQARMLPHRWPHPRSPSPTNNYAPWPRSGARLCAPCWLDNRVSRPSVSSSAGRRWTKNRMPYPA